MSHGGWKRNGHAWRRSASGRSARAKKTNSVEPRIWNKARNANNVLEDLIVAEYAVDLQVWGTYDVRGDLPGAQPDVTLDEAPQDETPKPAPPAADDGRLQVSRLGERIVGAHGPLSLDRPQLHFELREVACLVQGHAA